MSLTSSARAALAAVRSTSEPAPPPEIIAQADRLGAALRESNLQTVRAAAFVFLQETHPHFARRTLTYTPEGLPVLARPAWATPSRRAALESLALAFER